MSGRGGARDHRGAVGCEGEHGDGAVLGLRLKREGDPGQISFGRDGKVREHF